MNDALLLNWQSVAKPEIWSFVRRRIGVPAYRIWWLYTALQRLYKQSLKIDHIVRNLEFSDAIFVSLLYREAVPHQVLLGIANSTQVGLKMGSSKFT